MIHGTHRDADGQSIAEYFGKVTGRAQHPPYAAMGWPAGDGFETAALFCDYNGTNIEVHFVGRLTRKAIRETLRYAFLQLKVCRITAKPFAMRADLIEQLMRLGFEIEGLMQDYYGLRADALIMRLSPEPAMKWMR